MTDTMQQIEPLVMHRHFASQPERVYAAWTDPEMFKRWFGPGGFTVTHCEMDLVVGGRWRAEIRSAEGKSFGVSGVFKILDPSRRLVMSWLWDDRPAGAPEMEISVTLAPRDGGTEMTFRQSGFRTAEQRSSHTEGWTGTFEKLAAILA